jgi:uncharacterized coiled-coil protein SlyX
MEVNSNTTDIEASAILVSAGTNKNRIHFSKSVLANTYRTAKGKYVDWQHDRDKKIGFIQNAMLIDHMKNKTSNPDHILVNFIVWNDELNQVLDTDGANKATLDMRSGKLGVSMECVADEIRLVSTNGGKNTYIPLNDDTYFIFCLIKLGFFDLFDAAGLSNLAIDLCKLEFIGMGVVDEPANKFSKILSVNEKDLDLISTDIVKTNEKRFAANNIDVERINKEKIMEDQIKELQAKIAQYETTISELNSAIEAQSKTSNDELDAAIKELETAKGTVEGLQAQIQEKDSQITALNQKVVEFEKSLETSAGEVDQLEAQISDYQKAALLTDRKNKLAEVKVSMEDAKILSFDNEAFDTMIKTHEAKILAENNDQKDDIQFEGDKKVNGLPSATSSDKFDWDKVVCQMI